VKGEGRDERENEWRQRACGQRSHSNEAVVAEGDVTRRRTAAMSEDHTEGEKQKDNALRIRHDALLD
jgi:hypothetical protein